jgi:hypothetical protein
MTLLSQLTDDQFALASCGGALLGAFAVMAVSYHVGVLVRQSGSRGNIAPSRTTPRVSPDAAVGSERIERRAA